MTLKDWEQKAKWLVAHATTREEIRDLLAVGTRNLRDSGVAGLSDEAQLGFAYSAALQFATAALSAAGYRPNRGSDHHVKAIDSLAHTIGWDGKWIGRLQAFRKKRNLSSYEKPAEVSSTEVAEARDLARRLQSDVLAWLETTHPELI